MRKIYFAVYGSGLGHATRAMDIAAPLALEGDLVRYSCFGQGLRYVRAQDPTVEALECPALDVEWTEDGSFSSRGFLIHFPVMLRSLVKQLSFETENISKFDPNVVVSDSRLSAVFAARATGFPVVTLLNQFMVTLPPRYRRGPLGALFERIAGNALGLMWSLSEQVLMTDLPPPYTIGEANIAGSDLAGIARYVGFTTPDLAVSDERLEKARGVLDYDPRPLVFFQISGPDATKKRFADVVLASAKELSREYKVVVSLGRQGGPGEPTRLADGTLFYQWCPIKDELFLLSNVMVARSGHRTIGQCIDAGKPAVLVPIRNHSEQLGNAEKFEKLGLGIDIPPGDLLPSRLTEAVESCMSDPRYAKNLEEVGAVSRRYRGLELCTEAIKAYS